MNQNNIIINPKKKHIYSFILLHGMDSYPNSFNKFLNFFQNFSQYKNFLIILNLFYPQVLL